ncbi:hypothetical protein SAMN06269250_5546 [Spirosoma fluviale]|uniref:Uncharacterized protein n=1 Tax=Spirosoma fluviale TaxID=1597977 RepID=A0A286GN15_9BACT|nr:hypothetical protein SAMN06269250_5546 [Spirosoma fluviale]
MKSSENQSDNLLDTRLIDIIKTNINTIKSGIDWSQIEFEKDIAGNIVRLRSNDPMLCTWLQQTITITRPKATEPVVCYPNVFSDWKL